MLRVGDERRVDGVGRPADKAWVIIATHDGRVDDQTVGRILRALRHRLRLRQIDVAERADVSQQLVSRLERGRLAGMPIETVRRVFAGLDADAITVVHWRGGQLDRLLDERHADLVGRVTVMLRRHGWEVVPEATYSEFGERGSIDLLAWHARTRTLLVVEVKTEITSIEETLRRHDAKVRLAPKLARDRFGDTPRVVARLLVIAEGPTNRRRIGRSAPVLDAAYPHRGGLVRTWLRSPVRGMAGLLFVTGASTTGRRTGGPTRVRRQTGAGVA